MRNYNPTATEADDESCFYATAVFYCAALPDINENGIGDQLEESYAVACVREPFDPASEPASPLPMTVLTT